MNVAQTSNSNCSDIDTEYILVTKIYFAFFLVLFWTYNGTVFLHLDTGSLSGIISDFCIKIVILFPLYTSSVFSEPARMHLFI